MIQPMSLVMSCLAPSRFPRLVRNLLLLVAVCLPFACSASLPAQQTAPAMDISGSWTGVLGTGQNQLHLVVTFAKLSNGDYSGQLDSVDQGAVLPFSSAAIQGRKIHFEIAQIGGVYEGTLSDDQRQINGTWTQANTPPQPLNLTRSAASTGSSTNHSAVAAGPKQKPISLPLDVNVPIAPTAFQANGRMHLVYELHIVNVSPWNCVLTRVEVLAANSANSLASFSGAALDGMLERPGISALPKSKLAPGTEAVVFLWVTVDRKADVPGSIRHRISVMLGDYPDELSVETDPLPVHSGPIVITPPLRGDHWLAANGPSNSSGHRRALIPINGHAVISQRFAIDWVKLGSDGQTYHGDKLDNKNYYAFGEDALAVADGIVTEVKDGIPLNVPGIDSRAVPITLETIGGNHVILNIGNGCYAFYAHCCSNIKMSPPWDGCML